MLRAGLRLVRLLAKAKTLSRTPNPLKAAVPVKLRAIKPLTKAESPEMINIPLPLVGRG